MKNIVLAILCFFCVQDLTSQIEIKEKKEMIEIGRATPGGVWAMTVKMSSDSSYYLFLFRNFAYQYIVDVSSFSVPTSDIDSFYSFLTTNISKSKEKKTFEMNGVTITIWKNKIQFSTWNGVSWAYSSYLNLKQINQAVGKDDW
jgi:hypothetical protein